MKKIVPDENWCLGCKLCEVYCLTAHSKTQDIIKSHRRENPKPVSRIQVEDGKGFHFALSCRHCKDGNCVKACITGAMQRDENGQTFVDKDRCIGCLTCVLACPFGALVVQDGEKRTVTKCDLCMEMGEPACVKNCPNNALRIKEE
jgi:carbon-monoxide dehydrogenase iron sulfur subunit